MIHNYESFILNENEEKDYDCWTTGYHGEVSKYGNEYDVTLRDAVSFAHYFNSVSDKMKREEVEKVLKNLKPGEEYEFTPRGDIFGIFVKRKKKKV